LNAAKEKLEIVSGAAEPRFAGGFPRPALAGRNAFGLIQEYCTRKGKLNLYLTESLEKKEDIMKVLKILFMFYLLGVWVLLFIAAVISSICRVCIEAKEFLENSDSNRQKIKKYFQEEYRAFEILWTCRVKGHEWEDESSGRCKRGCGWHKARPF